MRVAHLHQIPLAAVEHHADLAPRRALEQLVEFLVGPVVDGQSARLEHDALVAVVEDRDLGVRRVAGIHVVRVFAFRLVTQSPAIRDDADRMRRDAQSPAGDVGLVRALIAGVAIAVVPLPVPVVVELRSRDPRLRVGCRTGPEREVDAFGNRVVAQRPDRRTPLVAQSAREADFADAFLLLHELHGLSDGAGSSGIACRPGTSARISRRPPPAIGRRRSRARSASRCRRPCRPASPTRRTAHASGWAWPC